MLKLFFILPFLMILIVGSLPVVFAENMFDVEIPSGASYEKADYFWILSAGDVTDDSIGSTTGIVTVFPDDSITWHNSDNAFHTITSVSRSGENTELTKNDEDGKFDSGFFTAGKSYSRQFAELGDFYYYCSLHPWMNGVVHVIKNPGSVQTIDKIASGYSDDGLGFEVKYILDTNLQKAVHVNPDEKTLTFTVSGDTENEQITFVLPVDLIENPNTVWVDGAMVDFETEITSTGTKLVIPIEPHSKEIKIMGSYVIPEFGFLAISILSVGLISVLFLTRTKFSINYRI